MVRTFPITPIGSVRTARHGCQSCVHKVDICECLTRSQKLEVGGQVERVYSLESTSRQEALAEARAEAINKAVAVGAKRDTVEVVEIDEVPLTYLPSNATLIRVKAVGDLGSPERS